jgi:hypothetical protein
MSLAVLETDFASFISETISDHSRTPRNRLQGFDRIKDKASRRKHIVGIQEDIRGLDAAEGVFF